MAAVWILEGYETKDGANPFDRFLGGLSGFKLAAVNAAMKQVLAAPEDRSGPEELQQQAVSEEAYNIAMQVIELREQHGLTQAELATRCGMNQADISRIERGSTSPTVRTLQRPLSRPTSGQTRRVIASVRQQANVRSCAGEIKCPDVHVSPTRPGQRTPTSFGPD